MRNASAASGLESTVDSDVLSVAQTRIDQHLKFFDTLERIRWQFTTAFGAGATAGVFFAVTDKVTMEQRYVALVIVGASCLGGLITQLRILGLTVVIWKRMLTLQTMQFHGLRTKISKDLDAWHNALSFPRLGILNSLRFRVLNVGMASCMLFSTLFGVATALAIDGSRLPRLISISSGIIAAVALIVVCIVGVKRYANALDRLE